MTLSQNIEMWFLCFSVQVKGVASAVLLEEAGTLLLFLMF